MTTASHTQKNVCFISSLRGDDEVRATVFRERGLVIPGIERELLAVADRAQAIGGDAQRHEIGARRDRAALAQCQIVLGRPALIAVTFDRYGPAWVLLQKRRVLVQRLLAGAVQFTAVELEEHR